MATAKKAAKKATPKEVKQIVLTKKQFQELSDIRFTLSTYTWELEDAFSKDKNLGQAAFEIGKITSKLSKTQSDLDKILDVIDPDQTNYWADFIGDKNDN